MFPEYDYYLMAHAQKPIFFYRLNGQVQVCLHGVNIQSAISSPAVCVSVHILVAKVSVLIFYLNVYWTHLKLHVISFKV